MNNTRKLIPLLCTLCLLLTACGGLGEASSAPIITTTATPSGVESYYTSYEARSMHLKVTSGTDELERMGDLNNIYRQQAYAVYQTLNTAAYNESYLSPSTGTPWVRLAFRPHSGSEQEMYTVYENDLVVVEHPVTGKQSYTAPAGTFYQTVALLNTLRTEQSRYFTFKAYEMGDAAGYTIHYANGKSEFFATGTDLPVVDMVGENLVRVNFRNTVTFYDTAKGKATALVAEQTDVAGDYVAAAYKGAIHLYPLLSKKSAACIYVAVEGEKHYPIQGISFTEDGLSLHIVGAHENDVVWDRTLAVEELVNGTTRYLLGDWRTAGTDATEKQQQQVGYNVLKKLRHKEKEWGHTFSALPRELLELDGQTYYLTEVGYWETSGDEDVYTVVTHLLVRGDLSVGYEATVSDNELSWNTAKDWFKK